MLRLTMGKEHRTKTEGRDEPRREREPSDELAKIEKLFQLATNDGASEEERRTAAVQCVSLMKKNELTMVPREEWEGAKKRIDGMRDAIVRLKKHSNSQMMKGLAFGALGMKFLKL